MMQTANANSRAPDNAAEAIDVLIAISVVAKRLAERLRAEVNEREEK